MERSSLTDGTLASTGPDLRDSRPGQPTAGQTCPWKVHAVTTSALPHNATKTQSSCPQRSGEALQVQPHKKKNLVTVKQKKI